MEILINHYLTEYLTILTITLLTIITPGPDFLTVVRNSLRYSKRSGIFTALGISIAVWIHVFYTLAGIGFILSKSLILFTIVKFLGAAYLIYLGWNCLQSSDINAQEYATTRKTISDFSSFKIGFINNALNPKATLFFLSIFTQIVSPETPLFVEIIYGATVSLSCFILFSLVAIFLNHKKTRHIFESYQRYLEKFMGITFISIGLKVALTTR